jgi:hypothetical protein
MFVLYCYVLMLSWMNSEKKKCGKIKTKKKEGRKENKIKRVRLRKDKIYVKFFLSCILILKISYEQNNLIKNIKI